MKHILLLLSLTVTAEIPASWLRAIPDEPLTVTGIDAMRLRASELREFNRLSVPLEDKDAIQYLVHVELIGGDFYLLRINDPVSKEINEDYVLVAFDKETAVLGLSTTVTTAIERMRGTHETIAPIRALADRFDAWAYLPRLLRESNWLPKGRFQDELFDSLRSVRAGVRFGTTIEARLEVDTKTADQASALAVLGKLAPGLMQRKSPGVESSVIEALERFTTWAEGSTAIAEATIPASAFRKLEEQQ